MGQEEQTQLSPPVEVPHVLPRSATWKETWTHVGFPTCFGVVVGSLWQWGIQPHLRYDLPNPVQGALLLMMLLSPWFHRHLTGQDPQRWREYLAGCASLGSFFILVWMSGYGGFICGGYLAIIIWIGISTSWWRYTLPPYRLALWHTLGVNIGALGGSILTFQLL